MSQRFATRDGRTAWLRLGVEEDPSEFIQAVDSIARIAREMCYFLRSRLVQDMEEERAFITGAVRRWPKEGTRCRNSLR